MVCRLPNDPLHSHALHSLTTSKPQNMSWFTRIISLCLQYSFPYAYSTHFPTRYLSSQDHQLTVFKKLVKSKVIDYWESKLRDEAASLKSLKYFHPEYLSLSKPHPIWWTAGENPYEVSKAVVQCKMLSGRYCTLLLTSNWSDSRCSSCPAPHCNLTETLEHVLLQCTAYDL